MSSCGCSRPTARSIAVSSIPRLHAAISGPGSATVNRPSFSPGRRRKRGGVPSPESLAATLAEVERVLDDIGKVEVAIAEMKAALW